MEADENEDGNRGTSVNAEACEQDSRCGELATDRDDSPGPPFATPQSDFQVIDGKASIEIARTHTAASINQRIPRTVTNQSEKSLDPGGRRKVTRWLNIASMQLAAKAHSQFQDSGFNAKERSNFPEVPGEKLRNKDLPEFQKAYSNSPIPRSRASSFVGSESSNGEGSSQIPLDVARHLSLPGPSSARLVTRPRHAHTLPSRNSSYTVPEEHVSDSFDGFVSSRGRSISTGTVGSIAHESKTSSVVEVSPTTLTPSGQDAPPKIVVSSDETTI